MNMVASGSAVCLPGNHEVKLLRALQGRNVTTGHGLDRSLEQLSVEPAEFRTQVAEFIDSLIGHYVLDEGRLVVAHAGLPEKMHGRASGAVRAFSLYGDTTGETDEFGLPVRYPWAQDYRGQAMVVYGHTPVTDPEWLNKTICIDNRLCLRRQADSSPLPGKRVRLRFGTGGVLRAGEAGCAASRSGPHT